MDLAKNQKGMMIANILVGLAIIALLTAVSIPNFQRFQSNANYDNAARALVSDLRYAQQLAVTEQKIYGVIINESLDYYQVVRIDTATTTLKTINLPANIGFSAVNGFTDDFIRFNSYGSVQESGEIILVNSEGELKTIDVKPSGYVQL